MKTIRINTILALLIFLFAAVSCGENNPVIENADKQVQIVVSVPQFSLKTRAGTIDALPAEKQIDNLYLFLFPTTPGGTVYKYYINSPSFTGGTWDQTEMVSLNLSTSEAGVRDVYIVANCADIRTSLDGVNSPADLQNILRETAQPWSPQINTSLLLVGNVNGHNFVPNPQLKTVPLIRAVGKLEVNLTLSDVHKSTPIVEGVAQYKYRYVDFDKNTYVLKQASKITDAVTSDWMPLTADQYTLDAEDKVSAVHITTYINERDDIGSWIEIYLPYDDGGFLPPPEFGEGDLYRLAIPQAIMRNTWYKYDIEVSK